mgnify:CR=1 FL=1
MGLISYDDAQLIKSYRFTKAGKNVGSITRKKLKVPKITVPKTAAIKLALKQPTFRPLRRLKLRQPTQARLRTRAQIRRPQLKPISLRIKQPVTRISGLGRI